MSPKEPSTPSVDGNVARRLAVASQQLAELSSSLAALAQELARSTSFTHVNSTRLDIIDSQDSATKPGLTDEISAPRDRRWLPLALGILASTIALTVVIFLFSRAGMP